MPQAHDLGHQKRVKSDEENRRRKRQENQRWRNKSGFSRSYIPSYSTPYRPSSIVASSPPPYRPVREWSGGGW